MQMYIVHALRYIADPCFLILHSWRHQMNKVSCTRFCINVNFKISIARNIRIVHTQATAAMRALRQNLWIT